tara:strand:+ start:333 stop:1445 length:1113 start_codon:yes stop_codon:yes gene_type:complete
LSSLFLQFTDTKVLALEEPVMQVLIRKNSSLRIRSDSKIPLVINSDIFFNKKVKALTVKKNDTKNILFFDEDKKNLYELDNTKGFLVTSEDKKGIWVGDKRYAGKIKVTFSDDLIFAVNVIGIEDYLTSVVGAEMPYKWPLEALKAQAIASRTYALMKKGNASYDIDSTKMDQVYNGLESRTNKTRKAVNKTRSIVIVYENKLINALFHSSSGGMTENSEDVWDNAFPYLISVKDFDKDNPQLNWKKLYSEKDLINLFPEIGGIQKMEILSISHTGRIKKIKVYGKYGSKVMKGKELRHQLDLKSTLFRFKFIKRNNKEILMIKGMGSGHGVGMSQWGAKFMARKGYKANEILEHYYSGVEVKPFQNDHI